MRRTEDKDVSFSSLLCTSAEMHKMETAFFVEDCAEPSLCVSFVRARVCRRGFAHAVTNMIALI